MGRKLRKIKTSTETVIFNGVRYYRYPQSKNHKAYFRHYDKALHREVWKFYNGPIPKGFHVHHKDNNPSNNDISNLECVSNTEHSKAHLKDLSREKSFRIGLKRFFTTSEGKAFLKQRMKQMLLSTRGRKYKCTICKKVFETPSTRTVKTCSKTCRAIRSKEYMRIYNARK